MKTISQEKNLNKRTKKMKTTKNVVIRENWIGFEVRNNSEEIASYRTFQDAKAKAEEIAKAENKSIRIIQSYL